MPTDHIPIGLVWLKRDLRLHDHAALYLASQQHKNILMLYVVEDSLQQESHFSERHLDFIKQSIADMNRQLKNLNTKVFVVQGEVLDIFEQLQNTFRIEALYSHLETGIGLTFTRDKAVKKVVYRTKDFMERIQATRSFSWVKKS